MTCGCMVPNDRHGDKRYIIYDDLKAAGEADNATADDAVKNLVKTYEAIKKGRIKVAPAKKKRTGK